MTTIAQAGQMPDRSEIDDRDPRLLVQVMVELGEEFGGPVDAELLWALPAGGSQHVGYFEVVGIPFFCEAVVGRGDVVRTITAAHPLASEEAPGGKDAPKVYVVRSVVEDAGHETLPVVLPPDTPPPILAEHADVLAEYGASVASGYGRLLAVDMPPEMEPADKQAVYETVDAWRKGGLLAQVPPEASRRDEDPEPGHSDRHPADLDDGMD